MVAAGISATSRYPVWGIGKPLPAGPKNSFTSDIPTLAYRGGKASDAELLSAVGAASRIGVLYVTDLPPAPFAHIRGSLDRVSGDPSLADRANKAYTKNLVWKDSFGQGKGGDGVDQKKVLDLSPHRLEAILKHDPELPSNVPELEAPLQWFNEIENGVAGRFVKALARASGVPAIASETALCSYRMVDYYERPADAVPPRCGEHRDFGTMTMIFSDGPGLEVEIDGSWRKIPSGRNSAIVLFGWCTQIRSNDRVKAALHRVRNVPSAGEKTIPARTSAILFLAPENTASLEPLVLPGEKKNYCYKTAEDLKGIMARKWRWREGTLSESDAAKEAQEIGSFPTQDSIVEHLVRA